MDSSKRNHSFDSLIGQVCRLHHHLVHGLLEGLGLYRGQPKLLRLLWVEEGRTHSELGELMGVQPATVTKMIQRMEKSGFVKRKPDPKDERVSRVYLTEEGSRVERDVKKVFKTMDKRALSGFSEAEQRQLEDLLARMRDNLGKGAEV